MMNELAKEIHKNATENGWWDKPRTFEEVVALCHSELSKALQEYMAGRPMVYFLEANGFVVSEMSEKRGEKTKGIAAEMADCIIRILDWAGKEGLDIDTIIREKMEYNKIRQPYTTYCTDKMPNGPTPGTLTNPHIL